MKKTPTQSLTKQSYIVLTVHHPPTAMDAGIMFPTHFGTSQPVSSSALVGTMGRSQGVVRLSRQATLRLRLSRHDARSQL
jgi:hypothetical protein